MVLERSFSASVAGSDTAASAIDAIDAPQPMAPRPLPTAPAVLVPAVPPAEWAPILAAYFSESLSCLANPSHHLTHMSSQQSAGTDHSFAGGSAAAAAGSGNGFMVADAASTGPCWRPSFSWSPAGARFYTIIVS